MRYLLALLLVLSAPVVQACGADSDCRVGDRVYRISMPDNFSAPVGAVVWAHGYRGSAAGVMRNGSLRKMAHARGLALIALHGVEGSWNLPNGPRTPDSTGALEFAYVESVIEDATVQFGIDPARLTLSGFSAGGMLVWNVACARPALFTGFVPFSGTFWREPPPTCAQPVSSLIHIHGTADQTVPLEGRAIGPTRQGEVARAIALYAAVGEFGSADRYLADTLTCTNRRNSQGKILDFCLFDGGHSFRTEYLEFALDRLETAARF